MRSKPLVAYFCLAALLTSYSYAAESTYKYEVVAQEGLKIDGITLLGFDLMAMNDLDTVIFSAAITTAAMQAQPEFLAAIMPCSKRVISSAA